MRLFDGMTVENGELNISGVGVSELKAQYGTPILKVRSSIQKFFTHRKLLVV